MFSGKIQLSRYALVGLLLWSVCWLACRQPVRQEYHLLAVYGEGGVSNITKSDVLFSARSTLLRPGGLMAENGDVLLIDPWLTVLRTSRPGKPPALRFTASDSLLLIDGQVRGLVADSTSGAAPFPDTSVIRGLETLIVKQPVDTSFLRRLAEIHPKLNLQLQLPPGHPVIPAILSMFRPSLLSISLAPDQLSLLEPQQQLTSLFLELETDSTFSDQPLPAFPALTNLVVRFRGNQPKGIRLSERWLSRNPQIAQLTVTDAEQVQAEGLLKPLKYPRVLILSGLIIPRSDILAKARFLERLLTDSSTFYRDLPDLRWATLLQTPRQSQLDSLIQTNPRLEVLEIMADGAALDAEGLTRLKNLHALTMVDADSIPLASLERLRGLRLLSYSTVSGNDEAAMAQLKAALPETMVVPNEGFCLGSGWLLLLVPALVFSILRATHQKQKFREKKSMLF